MEATKANVLTAVLYPFSLCWYELLFFDFYHEKKVMSSGLFPSGLSFMAAHWTNPEKSSQV